MKPTEQQRPLVSIITIVFNGEKSIERTIRSIIDQTYPAIEYIVIDGGSKDGTVEIIKKYQHKIAFWKSEPDKGIADAFNKGIAHAKGNIIGFVNADDWYNRDTVSKVVSHFQDYPVVYGDVQFWESGKMKHRTHGNHNKLSQGMSLAHPAVFVRRDMYERFGLFNVNFKIAMDYEFIARLYFNKISFYNIHDVIVNMSLGGLSDRKWKQAFWEERKVKELYLGKLMSYYLFAKQFVLFSVRNFFRKL